MYVRRSTDVVFSGDIAAIMTVVGHPTVDFKLALTASGVCRCKIVGLLDGTTKTERISFGEAGTQYSVNTFDDMTSLTSNYTGTDVTLDVTAVDTVGMPITWVQSSGPYWCEFGAMSGMSAQIQANELGLGSKIVHYVRVERVAPLSRDMEFTINGYDDQVFVPVSDFENICMPPNYVPQEFAFRATAKYAGE